LKAARPLTAHSSSKVAGPTLFTEKHNS